MIHAVTTYKIGESSYGSYIVLRNKENAQNVADSRGMGEVVEGFIEDGVLMPDYSVFEDSEIISRAPEILHWACFVGMIAINAGKCAPAFLLSDEGLIHEIAHLMHHDEYKTPENLLKVRGLIKKLQGMDLGFYEPI